MPEAKRTIIVVHENSEGNVIYGFEAPYAYEAPQGNFDGELIAELEEDSSPEAVEKLKRLNRIIELLEIPVVFGESEWINVHDEGFAFAKSFSLEQLG